MASRIRRLGRMQRELDAVQGALAAMDGPLGEVRFDPRDPASIEDAIREIERVVDERVGPYSDSAVVAQFVAAAKAQFRDRILQQAALARATGEEEI